MIISIIYIYIFKSVSSPSHQQRALRTQETQCVHCSEPRSAIGCLSKEKENLFHLTWIRYELESLKKTSINCFLSNKSWFYGLCRSQVNITYQRRDVLQQVRDSEIPDTERVCRVLEDFLKSVFANEQSRMKFTAY